ncbi:MAG: hypothetical protein WC624_00515 [Candidatus Margulisiibacteriota bacterium]
MAINPSIPVNFGKYGNTGTIDITKFSRTGSATTNTDNFALMLAQNMNAFDILYGDDQSRDDSIFGSSVFGTAPSSTSSIFGNVTGVNFPSDIGGVSTGYTGVSPAVEMIARSNLIGKTVDAIDPSTRQQFSGKVESVSVQGGILLINVGGISVPPENLLTVSE